MAVLESVQDAEKFNEKIEEIRNDSNWNKEDFPHAVSRVNNLLDQIEQSIVDRQAELSAKEEKLEGIREDFGEDRLSDLRKKSLDGSTRSYGVSLYELQETYKEIAGLRKKIAEWKTAQQELESIKSSKLNEIAEHYRDNYISGLLAENMSEAADILADHHVESELRQHKLVILNVLKDIVYQAEGITPKDVDLDRLLGPGFENVEITADADKDDDDVYELKGHNMEDTKVILQEMLDELGEDKISQMSLEEVSDLTDMTHGNLSRKIGRIDGKFDDFNKSMWVEKSTPSA